MKDESGDERMGLSGSLWSVSICLCLHGVNGFVGHGPGRSAEVLASSHGGSVGAEGAFIRASRTGFFSLFLLLLVGAMARGIRNWKCRVPNGEL